MTLIVTTGGRADAEQLQRARDVAAACDAPYVERRKRSLARLKAETGLAILVVDKSIKELATIADRAVILQRGQTVWQGAFDDLDTETRDRFLGV